LIIIEMDFNFHHLMELAIVGWNNNARKI